MSWMGYLAVAVAPLALLGVYILWVDLKVQRRRAETMRGYTGRTGPF